MKMDGTCKAPCFEREAKLSHICPSRSGSGPHMLAHSSPDYLEIDCLGISHFIYHPRLVSPLPTHAWAHSLCCLVTADVKNASY